ncbi:MAG: magnesium-dependent phosphatase-1 [Thermoplasmata archaeon]
MSNKTWLLAMDLDGTVWDHLDISSVQPPYIRIDEGIIENTKGIKIKVYKEAIDFIKWSKNNGAIVTSLSWNITKYAMEALKVLGIENLFDYHLIEYHPEKYKLLLKLLKELENKGIKILPKNIVYIDDRDIHINDIKKYIGDIIFIWMWKNTKNYDDVKKIIIEKVIGSGI